MKIRIPKNIELAIMELVAQNPSDEFTLFGKSERLNDIVTIVDFKIPKQNSTGANTVVEEEDFMQFYKDLPEEERKDWNVWIHSHNTMGAFWSGTDTKQMEDFKDLGMDWGVHVVFSDVLEDTKTKKKRMLGALSSYFPVVSHNKDVPIEIVNGQEPRLKKYQNKIGKLNTEIGEHEDNLQSIIERYNTDVEELTKEFNKLYEGASEELETLVEKRDEAYLESMKVKELDLELAEKNDTFVYTPPSKAGKKSNLKTMTDEELEEYYEGYYGNGIGYDTTPDVPTANDEKRFARMQFVDAFHEYNFIRFDDSTYVYNDVYHGLGENGVVDLMEDDLDGKVWDSLMGKRIVNCKNLE